MKLKRLVLPALGLFAAVGITGAATVYAEENGTATIPSTVYIGNIDVSGMTEREAESAVHAYVESLSGTVFTLTAGQNSVQTTAEEIGLTLANTEIASEAVNLGKTGSLLERYKAKKDLENETKVFELDFEVDENSVASLLNENSSNLNVDAVDNGLTRTNGAFEIVEGSEGIEVNVGNSILAIEDYLSNDWDGNAAEIALVTDVAEPRGTKEELGKVQDVLGTYHTDFSSSASGRSKNVKNGCDMINGTLVYPGEQFSVYKEVSPFDAEHGYELAGSYENGTTVQTYGGGICQVSTTLYNAVILAELQVDERFNHSMIVNYVKPSMDAAIAGTSKDLKFTNNTEAPIYIDGYTSGGVLYFTIYGEETRPSNRVVTYESETLSQTNPGVSLQASGAHPVGYVASSGTPHTGYTAKLWKIVTVDGKEESREAVNSSSYKATNKIITVGTATGNSEAAAQISAAIATGDEATVRAIAAQYANAPSDADIAAQQAAAAAAQQAAEAAAAAEQEAAAKEESKKEENKKEETPKEKSGGDED